EPGDRRRPGAGTGVPRRVRAGVCAGPGADALSLGDALSFGTLYFMRAYKLRLWSGSCFSRNIPVALLVASLLWHHKAIHLVTKLSPGCIRRIDCWRKCNSYADQ